ncbi:glycosyltransferase [Pedobacter sp. PLR]|uniref:beta-1,6-N-acetylglucosaminyltransferase n=1 Tax=Pedobacter sp. PLR TaxID=2994465 RepID=UPI0022455099|nr:beta-1,6-N-acetylglucosaminyltransferase [Pedobacter sp. PLR]MCX2449857.1 glycosyltransferase [Pedobacter sp. PLR]
MKIAHLIMAYKNSGQVERMIKAMNHPNFHFYIHLDLKSDIKEFEHLESMKGVSLIINRVLCNWGGFSFVRAIMSSLSEILKKNESYSFINLMSGQDYLIKPADQLYQLYATHPGKCFISYDQDPKALWWKDAVTRAELYHFTDLKFKGKYFIQGIFNKVLPKRSFPLSIPLYGSSDSSWWTIPSDCAAYIVEFMKSHPRLERFMQYTWGSDEFIIATIIMNSPFKDQVINDNLRFISWESGRPNPRILTDSDFELIKASGKFYARKFDNQVNVKILEQLDQFVGVKA